MTIFNIHFFTQVQNQGEAPSGQGLKHDFTL